ncbi:MAG: acyltransferase [Jannaschia sp.]
MIPRFSVGPGLVRVGLAALVVLSHMSSLEIGRPAVFAFFMLSGYWVLRMYEEKYRTLPLRVFYLSRILRVWLAFATAFLIVFLLRGGTDWTLLTGLPLLGIATTGRDVLGTSWSLDIEIQFYLAVPLLWVLLQWMGNAPGRRALLLCAAGVLTLLGWYLQLAHGVWTVLSYLPSFCLGMFIWHVRMRASTRHALASLLVFGIAGLVVALVPDLRPLLLKTVAAPVHEDWFGMVWVAMLMPFLAWNVAQRSGPMDMHLGNYSYALYITHWPVIAFLRPVLEPLSLLDRGVILVVVIVVSTLFYMTVDRGWEALRRHLIGRMSRGTKPSGSLVL